MIKGLFMCQLNIFSFCKSDDNKGSINSTTANIPKEKDEPPFICNILFLGISWIFVPISGLC